MPFPICSCNLFAQVVMLYYRTVSNVPELSHNCLGLVHKSVRLDVKAISNRVHIWVIFIIVKVHIIATHRGTTVNLNS